jgi:hypothetical protein
MEEIFIVVPKSVSLEDISDVLRRYWTLEEHRDQPSVELDLNRRAYVAELDEAETDADPLFHEPGERESLYERVGDFRILSLRYRSPELGRDMASAIAKSELAERPLLLNADGTYLTPEEFLSRLRETPPAGLADARGDGDGGPVPLERQGR